MANSTIKHGSRLLFAMALLFVCKQAAAGTPVTITFDGGPSGSSTGNFDGSFIYDQGQSGSGGVFQFTDPKVIHQVAFQGDTIPGVVADGVNCEPFTITLAGKTFKLESKATDTKAKTVTYVTIILPTNFMFSPTALPLCDFGDPSMPVFPSQAPAGSKFILSGSTTYTGCIKHVSCDPSTSSMQSMAPEAQPPVYIYVYVNAAPGPYPTCYAPSSRRCYRRPCW